MSTLTWITEKDLEREIKNKGDEFCWKNNMKILYRWWENEKCWRSARRSQQGTNELQWKKKRTGTQAKKSLVSAHEIFFP